MNISEKLKKEFKQINNVFFEKEFGQEFLRIEVNFKSMDMVAEISKKISAYLDDNDFSDKEYFLDIYSSGTDKVLELDELKDYLNEQVLVTLETEIKGLTDCQGELVEVDKDSIIVKWNAKGQFRKLETKKENIKQIKLYAKAK